MRIEMAITGLAAALLLGGCGSTDGIVAQPPGSTVETPVNPDPEPDPVMQPDSVEPDLEPDPVEPDSGCTADGDGDGIVDCEDEYPDTPNPNVWPDGPDRDCAADGDGDGYPDCIDECPLNPDKHSLGGEIAFTVEFLPHSRVEFTEQQREGIERCLTSAAEEWARFLRAPQDVTIEILVQPVDRIAASGTSQKQAFVYNNGSCDVFEQGAAAEIRTGIDPNGAEADAKITLNPAVSWWFDPDPLSRTAPVPEGQEDAYSILLHEMGHVLGFRWMSSLQTTWGELVDGEREDDAVGGRCYFVGESAMAIEGRPVQLSSLDCQHIRVGDENVVMGGAFWSDRQYISPLEVAMLADIGLPMRGPDDGDLYDCER